MIVDIPDPVFLNNLPAFDQYLKRFGYTFKNQINELGGYAILKNKKITEKLFTNIVKRYETRKGGYTRILKNGFRYGDMAPLAVIELVDRDEKVKGLDSGPVQKKTHDDETKSDEKSIDSSQQNQGQNIDQKVQKSELKENEEIAKKLDKKIEKPRNF